MKIVGKLATEFEKAEAFGDAATDRFALAGFNAGRWTLQCRDALRHDSSKDQIEPSWPAHRDLQRYNLLLGIDIASLLDNDSLWIEIGPGVRASAMLPIVGKQGVTLKAIGPHKRMVPAGIAFRFGSVPDDRAFLEENRGAARLVTDVYGAVSYCDDPLQALVYGSLLVGDKGLFATFTELFRFGDLHAWDRITEFFRVSMRQAINFETVSVLGDASKAYSTCVRIRVRGAARTTLEIDDLFEAARQKIGAPSQATVLWRSNDRSASIRRVDYGDGEG